MRKTIWKFPFRISDVVSIDMPRGAIVLHVETQFEAPTIWALVDADAPTVARTFRIFGTGHAVPDDVKHVGTFQEGRFVWHLFEPLTFADVMRGFF